MGWSATGGSALRWDGIEQWARVLRHSRRAARRRHPGVEGVEAGGKCNSMCTALAFSPLAFTYLLSSNAAVHMGAVVCAFCSPFK